STLQPRTALTRRRPALVRTKVVLPILPPPSRLGQVVGHAPTAERGARSRSLLKLEAPLCYGKGEKSPWEFLLPRGRRISLGVFSPFMEELVFRFPRNTLDSRRSSPIMENEPLLLRTFLGETLRLS